MGQQHANAVAIVGAGPVGLTLACQLSLDGVRVVCFDEANGLCDFPRAVGLDDESMRIFQGVGVDSQQLATYVMDCAGIKYYGERGQFLTMIHPKDRPYGHFKGASFYQPHLDRLLLERARALGVEVRFGHKVAGVEVFEDRAVLSVEHGGRVSLHEAAFVVGCDGSRSFVRKALRIGFSGNTFEQRWLVVDTKNDARAERYAEVWCNSERPTVSIPRRQGIRRWEFMLKKGERAADFDTFEKIRPLLQERMSVEAAEIERFNVYTFHSRVADRYRRGRAFLAGDAAHVIPPFMAQGMAAGIRDAGNLGWKLSGVLQGRLRSDVLDSYEAERRPHLLAMGKLSEWAGGFMMPQSKLQSHAKDLVLAGVGKIPGIASAIEDARMRPEPVYQRGLFAEGQRFAGRMFPQPRVRLEAGDEALLDQLMGEGFTLVVCGSAPCAVLNPLATRLQRLNCQYVQVVPQGLFVDRRFRRLEHARVVEDIHNALGAWRRDRRTECFLLRPDKFVVCGFSLLAQSEVVGWLDEHLLGAATLDTRRGTRPVCGEASSTSEAPRPNGRTDYQAQSVSSH